MLDAASAAGVVEKSSAEIGVAMSNYLFISPVLKQSSYLCKLQANADTLLQATHYTPTTAKIAMQDDRTICRSKAIM